MKRTFVLDLARGYKGKRESKFGDGRWICDKEYIVTVTHAVKYERRMISREYLLSDETYVCIEIAFFMAGMLTVYYVYAKKMA